jgi:hypothetical protein
LASHADPEIEIELRRGGVFNSPLHPRPQVVVAARRGHRLRERH